MFLSLNKMKKTAKLMLASAIGLAIWTVWSHPATETKTAQAVTPVEAPVATKVLSRHSVAKSAPKNETEIALNKLGLSMANSFGVSAQSKPQP
jgi:hypothetical protein